MATERLSVLLWGAGQHGCAVAEYARAVGWTVLGFIDEDETKRGSIVDAFGTRVVLSALDLLACLVGERAWPAPVDRIIPTVGDNGTRFRQAHALGPYLAPPLVHPSAVISPTARIGDGSVICPLALVNTEAELGRAVIINSSSVVGHNARIGDGAHVGPGVVLTGAVQVGARTFMGSGAVAIPGVQIGADATVGAGAVVLREVPDGAIAVGVPARLREGIERGNATQENSAVAAAPLRP
jgi:UDP-perosamine 4-acetyltransferase